MLYLSIRGTKKKFMSDIKQRTAIKEFVEYWKDKGYEKGHTQPFWMSLLRDVFGIERPEEFIDFEDQTHIDGTSYMDARIPSTKVLIEQKSSKIDLYKSIKQSDGTYLTPFQQARRYIVDLPLSDHPRWVVTCNFQKFCVYDMERPNGEPQEILLKDLEKEYYRLQFLVDTGKEHLRKEMEVSIKAGDIVGLLYDAFLKQYIKKDSEETLKSLNKLCVRLVFCLYAEDAGIFGEHDMFLNYMKQFDTAHSRKALIELFKVLDTKPEDRDPYLEPELKAFPYVNGGLFADEDIVIPQFTDEIRDLLLNKASADFDWSEISPTIFGAVFESTLNPETRRKGGMHYTSIENIHKVIDPLFMDELRAEFKNILSITDGKKQTKTLEDFQNKISTLTFLDPACGSGNFLTETYLSLRKLENEVIRAMTNGQRAWGIVKNPIKVSIGQFYGIEINDFAVTVAKTALWIAESQMMKQTENIVQMDLDFLPLKTYTNIVEGNALRIDWEEVIPKDRLNYIMGNPPFIGARLMSDSQKSDMLKVFGDKWKNVGNLDYVSCWYKKSVDIMKGTKILTALVSTNSITQGEQVPILWKPLFEEGISINFAHRTFRWDSESNSKAHVYCVIVGFSYIEQQKRLYTNGRMQKVKNINAYLNDGLNIFIESRNKPLQNVEPMVFGSMPNDNGNLLLTPSERQIIIKKYPQITEYIKLCLGSEEYINNKERYCLWLYNVEPSIYRDIPEIRVRIQNIKSVREKSNREATRKLASKPYLFGEIRQPNTDFLLIPSVSSKQRRYIPIGFANKNVIATNLVLIIPNATLYHFGIMTSNIHMAWMRTFCGRLGDGYRYSAKIVYNNFPWCNPTEKQRAKIEQTAQGILDARALYPECSLADLYDELTMPAELRKAHQANDRAVMEAYGFYKKDETTGKIKPISESETVAKLMQMYQELTK